MNPDIRRNENLLDLRNPAKKQPPTKKIRRFLKITSLVLVVLVVILAGTLFTTKINKKEDLNSAIVIKAKISKHLVLPKNEEPALATITDTTKLTTPFLKKSTDGDKLLIYQDAKKVIIYRPSIDRIIDVGPVSIAPADGQ